MKRFFLFLPILFLFACEEEQTQAQKNQEMLDKLQAEVMEIHDAVMPKTADINRVGRQLKAILKENTLDEEMTQKVSDQILQLTKADMAMTDWMKGYKMPSKKDAFESVVKYLNEEKVKMTKVSDLMNTSLAEGKKLLEQVKSK